MNPNFDNTVASIRRNDRLNALNNVLPECSCDNPECKEVCANASEIARNLSLDPVPLIEDAVRKHILPKYKCGAMPSAEGFSSVKPYPHYGAKIPGCRFGYTYGSHPDATDDQLAGGKKSSGNASTHQISQSAPSKRVKNAFPGAAELQKEFEAQFSKDPVRKAIENPNELPDEMKKNLGRPQLKSATLPKDKIQEILDETDAFIKKHRTSAKRISGELYDKLSEIYRENLKEELRQQGDSSDISQINARVSAAKRTYKAFLKLHYDRNKRQEGALPVSPEDAIKQGYVEATRTENRYHGGYKGNKKFYHPETGYEVVFDKDGEIVSTPEEVGTYNYGPNLDAKIADHVIYDMLPYWILGNSKEDSTNIIFRILGK